ncbi:MAG TPA: sugar ABC transporter permease [Bacillota bacterium]|jgi:ABC-type sugar transport system permease subunit|nr:sugar ABC transporter permease [Bacillota bacterium]HOB91154.1 sugar ABC transporter permease [Bacillota bacterium]HPZ54281.1 sugar ABC transporter permease [Bacillota bacterium]HQD17564.1 sugar ABC transporter permease [Bacillota bacterium]
MKARAKGRQAFSLAQQKALTGYLFSAPFIIGFILFFLAPFVQAIVFSLNNLKIITGGYELEYIGLENFRYALFVDPDFVRVFAETVVKMLVEVPSIIFFSFFSALLLNQQFKGRLLARTIFFLPVVMTSGVILTLESGDYMSNLLEQTNTSAANALTGPLLTAFLMQLKLPREMLSYVVTVVEHIPDVIRASGIQILIFLAGLQSIPETLYEASKVEGATPWQTFWMITMPMMSPMVFANVIYSIIDSFLSSSNQLVRYIRDTAFAGAGFGIGTAMGVMYFAAVTIILLIVARIMSGWVFYHE